MKNLEIPHENERGRGYRFFEILPGALSFLLILTPVLLSLINVTLAAFFILAYVLIYFTRSVAVDIRALAGYRVMREHEKVDWNALLEDLEAGSVADPQAVRPKWHYDNLLRLSVQPPVLKPSEMLHAVIIATWNESKDVVEPTILSLVNAGYDVKNKIILILAYEERGGEQKAMESKALVEKYKDKFKYAVALEHPDGRPDEIIGKGSNLTWAGHALQEYVEKHHIDPLKVAVTTLDSDNRPHSKYFSALSYLYCSSPDPLRASYQPLPMFTSNIWDVPAPMRVVATGNNFFYIVLTQRPHLERNFSAHAQCLKALIDMEFWSMRTVVEDGHQFWRSYFHFDGDYRVYPISIPVFCDAVLADGYVKTLKAQFVQIRRWTYGASDIAYIANQALFRKSKAPKRDIAIKFFRLLENHVSWATGALILLLAAFVPVLINPQSYAANELPLIVSRIQTIGLVGALASLFVALKTLPPRPARYKRHRTIFMILQWAYLPVTTIVYGSLAAIYSQTRLVFAKYPTKFDVTAKAVRK
ncbi:MAG TPA: hypothetical protein VLH84_03215 [Patescibacteria group bacterium]|nr:hypothetical protein [Patescibacteria group bacterium]